MTTRRSGPRRKRIWSRQQRLEIILPTGGPVQPLQYSLTEAYRAQRDIGVMDPGCTVAGAIVNYSFAASSVGATVYGADAAVVWGVIAGGYSAPPTTFTNAPPDPIDQPHEDWMFWEHTALPQGSATVHQTSSNGGQGTRGSGPVVIRSKRKLDELGDDIFLCATIDQASVGNNSQVQVFFTTSVLFLLP